jgi:hypothetical protein
MVAEASVLTCAHVINEALGLPDEQQQQPLEVVTLDFPFLAPQQRCEARVVVWHPMAPDGSGDLAGLDILSSLPAEAGPIRCIEQAELWDSAFHILGFPGGHDEGVYSRGRILGPLANGHVQLDAEGAFPILPGFSGSPVWSEAVKGVVGLLVTAETNRQAPAGFMIPVALLRQAWERVQYREQVPPPKPAFIPTVGGAIAPSSPFYIERSADRQAAQAMQQQDGKILVISGPRQIGKSSLLARIIAQARAAEKHVGYIDFQSSFDHEDFQDSPRFYQLFFGLLSEEIGLKDRTNDTNHWNPQRSNSANGTRYVRRYLLQEIAQPLLIAIDEADRLYHANFCADFFGMLRGWHNGRFNNPELERLELALVISTETGALIRDPNQSPFNTTASTTFPLDDFDAGHVHTLNQLHGNCLSPAELQQLQDLVNGHPYLVRQALYCVATERMAAAQLLHTPCIRIAPDHLLSIYDITNASWSVVTTYGKDSTTCSDVAHARKHRCITIYNRLA